MERIRKLIKIIKDFLSSKKEKEKLIYSNYSENDYIVYDRDEKESFIREVSIKSLLGEIDITPDTTNLDKKTINFCKKVSKKGMIIGGSVLLKSCGLLNRKNNDIDVFWDVSKALEEGIISNDNIINKSYGDYAGNIIRYKIKMEDMVVDIFDIKHENYNKVDEINFGDPIETLSIKLDYYRIKDMVDYKFIKEKLNI